MSAPAYERPVEQATRASGLLLQFNRARVIDVPELQVAQRVSHLGGEKDDAVRLAFALVVRALRLGSVCVSVATLRADVEGSLEGEPPGELPWPEPGDWVQRIEASQLVTLGDTPAGARPLRLVEGLLYLERSWEQQEVVRTGLLTRASITDHEIDEALLEAQAASLFDGEGLEEGEPDLQREAAERAVRSRVLVLAGGPGTGKTTTIARLLALLALQGRSAPAVALAAPSGKAAARLQEAVQGELSHIELPDEIRASLRSVSGVTLHRLLGAVPGQRVRRHAESPIEADVVVVDETSMVSLAQMAQLLEALRPEARLVLVGDPDQLTSIDAGAVLADITAAAESGTAPIPLVRLKHSWRFGGVIDRLAAAVRNGDEAALAEVLSDEDPSVRTTVSYVPMDDNGVVDPQGLAMIRALALPPVAAAVRAALRGEAGAALEALRLHRILCAHRSGPENTGVWNRRLEHWLRAELPDYEPTSRGRYAGQPLLITRNDQDLGVSNGDSGIIVRAGQSLRAAIDLGDRPLLLPPALLDSVETVYAMTIHKAQGSQFDEVTVILPLAGSPLLTRQLLYTAVTRAAKRVTIVAHPDALAQAVRRLALRASGLRTRL